MIPIRETETGVMFSIRVLPKSSRSEITGIQDDALKIKIAAPPVEGRANEACMELLAERLGVRKSQISIVSGHQSRKKTVAVAGLKKKDIESLLFSGK
jgi:uncharacterized protein (TIGR00251 family)